jgi:Ni/Co efflux regulator RcnB
MKYLLTTALALSLLSGTAVMAQPNTRDRSDQNDNRGDQNKNDQNRKGPGRGNAAPAAPNNQASRERAAPAAPPAPVAPSAQATRERAAPSTPPTPIPPRTQATRERAAPATRRGQASNVRTPPPAPNVQEQNHRPDDRNNPVFQGLRNNPNVRVATPRWSRGDRLPDQYRQNQYVVGDWQQLGLRRPPSNYHWVRDDNNNFFLALIATGMIAETVYRDDREQLWRQRYSREYTYSDDIYYQQCRSEPDPAGVIVGALIGGLLGNAAGSGRTGATLRPAFARERA